MALAGACVMSTVALLVGEYADPFSQKETLRILESDGHSIRLVDVREDWAAVSPFQFFNLHQFERSCSNFIEIFDAENCIQ